MTYRVKGWASFQSYKDRNPTWIRLHRSLLDDYEFATLSLQARAMLPLLWLLAAENADPTSGIIGTSIERIAFRLRLNSSDVKEALTHLIEKGFVITDEPLNHACNDSVYNPCKSVTPETETETEERQIQRQREKRVHKIVTEPPLFDQFWQAYPRQRRGDRDKALAAYRKAIAENKTTEEQIHAAVVRYASSRDVAQGYAAGAAAWLNNAGFDNQPIAATSKPADGLTDYERGLLGAVTGFSAQA